MKPALLWLAAGVILTLLVYQFHGGARRLGDFIAFGLFWTVFLIGTPVIYGTSKAYERWLEHLAQMRMEADERVRLRRAKPVRIL